MHAPPCSPQHCSQERRHRSSLSVHRQAWIKKTWYSQERYEVIKGMKRYHLRQYGWTLPALSGREISQSEKDTLSNLTYTHTYVHKHQAPWYTENRLVAARGRGWVVEKWRTVFVLFLLKFKCIERKPKSPLWQWSCCSLTLTNLGMCASAAPRPRPDTHTHTHTGPLLCHPKRAGTAHECSLHGGLLHSPSPWLASHLNTAFGEASSHGSLLWPMCTASSVFTLP